MPIHGFVGPFGSGKTLLMTRMLYREYLKGRRIFTNYKVNFPHEPLNADTLVRMGRDLQNCVLGVDEIHVLFDSRQSGSDRNRLGSYFVLQTRKRGVDMFFTTQDPGQVDLRIRNNTDNWAMSKKLGASPFFETRLFNRYWKRMARFFFDGRKTFGLYDTTEAITDFRKPLTEKEKKAKKS